MYQVACPGCGAPVVFRSAASVFAVCEYCRTTVLKDAAGVRDLGKMGEVLEDYSPLRIGSSGVYEGRAFDVVGRIQLHYPAGFWNEWYILLNDGSAAWLSDASGQYAITIETAAPERVPAFDELRPGRRQRFGEREFVAADVRTARCTAGQGELPFAVGAGWEARVADFRFERRFLTLDYSEGPQPRLYLGAAVTLDALKCQLLRGVEEIKDSAGRYKGKVARLECPSCGASASFSPGATTHLVCPSCQAQIDTAGGVTEVLEAGRRVEAVRTTLELGTTATIDGAAHTLIGLVRRTDNDPEEASSWTEYLLYSEKSGFLWLVETDEGWERAEVLDNWPQWSGGGQATLEGAKYQKLWEYEAEVTFAAGAFNWRVATGDRVQVVEYALGKLKLAQESSADEMTWSRSRPVPQEQLSAWFGKAVAGARAAGATEITSSCKSMAKWMGIAVLAINVIPWMIEPGAVTGIVLFALLALFVPAVVLDLIGGKESS